MMKYTLVYLCVKQNRYYRTNHHSGKLCEIVIAVDAKNFIKKL